MRIMLEKPDPGRIVAADDAAQVHAAIEDANLLHGSFDPASHDDDVDRIVAWSGSMGESLAEPDLRNWMGPGLERFREVMTALAPSLDASGKTLLIRPHALHVISDIPGAVTFLREFGDGPFGLALSPAEMLTPAMMETLSDWLARLFETFGGRMSMLFLSDVAVDEQAGRVRPVPLGGGVLPRDCVLRLLREHVPDGTPIVLQDVEVDRQRQWLGGGSAY